MRTCVSKNLSNAELEKKPVMVFIHGGAYMSGEADLYMPTKLMDKDVVVVVVQYRLGTLGLFTIQSKYKMKRNFNFKTDSEY